MKRLLIVGAGGFGREVLAWALQHPECGKLWEPAGFLDDNRSALDEFDCGVEVLDSIAGHQPDAKTCYVCAIGEPSVKRKVCESLLSRGAEFIQLIHPSVILGPRVELGVGVVLCPRVTLTTDIRVGAFAAINCHSSVGHDAELGDWATVSGHCDLMGGAVLGYEAFLGSGARVLPSKRVADGSYVGAGSVVIRSTKPGQRVFGNPAAPVDC
jgi:sugar O-acyltransferase (sialic acid O-acetyltransferase NeuD family)